MTTADLQRSATMMRAVGWVTLVMLVEAFLYPHEMQHLWADVPALFIICAVLWIWHPARRRHGFGT